MTESPPESKKKVSISYGEDLDEAIDILVDAGLADSRSDFFRSAAVSHLLLLTTGSDAIDGALPQGYGREDVEDVLTALWEVDRRL